MFDNLPPKPTCLVLFDGAGIASIGLRQAGFTTIGVEIDPVAYAFGEAILEADQLRGVSKTILGSVTDSYVRDLVATSTAVWASPPCQLHSSARNPGSSPGNYSEDFLEWSLNLAKEIHPKTMWVENVTRLGKGQNDWGKVYNARQFGTDQSRNRVVGGNYPPPKTIHPYSKRYPNVCPCVTATEFRGCASDTRRASRFYKRKLTLGEVAYHMDIPTWALTAMMFVDAGCKTPAQHVQAVYRAMGNGVPVKMAEAFGDAEMARINNQPEVAFRA